MRVEQHIVAVVIVVCVLVFVALKHHVSLGRFGSICTASWFGDLASSMFDCNVNVTENKLASLFSAVRLYTHAY